MPTFVYLMKPSFPPLSDRMALAEAELMTAHFHYLDSVGLSGRLVLAGPADNGSFGLAIFEAESQEHAEKLMLADPIISVGAIKGSCHPFTIAVKHCELPVN